MSQFNSGLLSGGMLAVATSNQISSSVLSALRKTESGAYSCGYNIGAGLANGMAASLGRVQSIATQLAAAAEKAKTCKSPRFTVRPGFLISWGSIGVEDMRVGIKKMFGKVKKTNL